jgi:hypothetical protein
LALWHVIPSIAARWSASNPWRMPSNDTAKATPRKSVGSEVAVIGWNGGIGWSPMATLVTRQRSRI